MWYFYSASHAIIQSSNLCDSIIDFWRFHALCIQSSKSRWFVFMILISGTFLIFICLQVYVNFSMVFFSFFFVCWISVIGMEQKIAFNKFYLNQFNYVSLILNLRFFKASIQKDNDGNQPESGNQVWHLCLWR